MNVDKLQFHKVHLRSIFTHYFIFETISYISMNLHLKDSKKWDTT